MMNWNLLIFFIALTPGVICTIAVVVDILMPSITVWPHAEGDTWVFMISLFLWGLFYFATLALWIYSLFGLTGLTPLAWLGLILFIAGTAFLIWSMMTLKIHVSLGFKGEQVTSGPYKLCRNPQTTGIFIQLTGIVIMSPSFSLITLALLHIILLILAVIKEERWLSEQYSESYETYQADTPNRFIPDIGKLYKKRN